MRNLFTKWLSALLIAALLMTPAALMEEAPDAEAVETAAIVWDPAEAVAEDAAEEAETAETAGAEAYADAGEPAEAVEPEADAEPAPAGDAGEAVEADVAAEAVDEAVEETAELGLESDGEVDLALESDEAAYEDAAGEQGIAIDETNFEDSTFAEYVSTHFDTDHNGYLSQDEAADVDYIDLYLYVGRNLQYDEDSNPIGLPITSLKGIEYFPNVDTIYVRSDKLKTPDLSANTKLKSLVCAYCGLTTLDLTYNTQLTYIRCEGNPLEELNISTLEKITPYIDPANRSIYPLDEEGQFAAHYEYRGGNLWYPYLAKLIVDADTVILPNRVVAIDEDHFPDDALRAYIDEKCGVEGYLTEDMVNYVYNVTLGAWTDEGAGFVGLGVRDLTGLEYLSKLEELYCGNNPIETKTLDVSGFKELRDLHCQDCGLTKLILGDVDLSELNCADNALTEVNVGQQKNLQLLNCSGNKLSGLDVSGNEKLTALYCDNNALSKLDVSKNARLRNLGCAANKLTALDVSNNTRLRQLRCYGNQIARLDVTKNAQLMRGLSEGSHGSGKGYGVDYLCDYILSSDSAELDIRLEYDKTTSVNNSAAATEPAAPAVAPAAPAAPETPAAPVVPATPVIAAVSKSSKTTIAAAPGTVAQLDLGGVAGKKFKASNKKVATVDQTGLVTIKKAGKTKITFKVGKKTRKVTLTVKDPTIPTAIYLNLAGTVPAQVGVPQALTVTLPEGTNSGIKWKSSNKKVATVSGGVVTFKKAGKVTITATATRGKKKAKVKFKVSK